MAKIDKIYHDLLLNILQHGREYEDPKRKGIKRLQIPSYTFGYDLREGFPAITTKKLYWKAVVGELLWFLRGDTNIKYLLDNEINIWNKDAYNHYCKLCDKQFLERRLSFDLFISYIKNAKSISKLKLDSLKNAEKDNLHALVPEEYTLGDCGRIYGAQWRKWNAIGHCNLSEDGFASKYIDQISNLIKNLKESPLATDHIVTAWNPAEKDQMALPPCHNFFQINVWELYLHERNQWTKEHIGNGFQRGMLTNKECNEIGAPKYGFELTWNQRSVDTFLGLPFNIASYGLLAHIIGKLTNMVPMSLKGTLNNVHIYDNALKGVEEQLSRNTDIYDNCELRIKTATNRSIEKFQEDVISLDKMLNEFEINQFVLEGYESYPSIKVEMLERNG